MNKNMKLFSAALVLVGLVTSGCVTTETDTGLGGGVSQSMSLTDKALHAFTAVCLKTAPSFAGAEQAAKAYGINDMDDLGFQVMGMTDDKLLGAQIKADVECAITTPSQTEDGLTAKFLQSVSQFTGRDVGSDNPVNIDIKGESFITGHDRSGGEAYVILIPSSRY